MTTWIAIFSHDLDGESVRELEVEGSNKTEALTNLEAHSFGEGWQHYSLSNIRPKRGGQRPGAGRPKGIKRAGTYGEGVATKPVRVPIDIADNLPEMLQNLNQLKDLLNDWEQEANSGKAITSPRYDRARKLISEIRALGF
jgi:hypothetical protein